MEQTPNVWDKSKAWLSDLAKKVMEEAEQLSKEEVSEEAPKSYWNEFQTISDFHDLNSHDHAKAASEQLDQTGKVGLIQRASKPNQKEMAQYQKGEALPTSPSLLKMLKNMAAKFGHLKEWKEALKEVKTTSTANKSPKPKKKPAKTTKKSKKPIKKASKKAPKR